MATSLAAAATVVAEATLALPAEAAEGLQVVRYREGEQYSYHTDYFTESQRRSRIPQLASGGRPASTFFLTQSPHGTWKTVGDIW